MPERTTNTSGATARYKTVLAWLVIIILFLWVCNNALGSYGTYAFWTLGGAIVLIGARRDGFQGKVTVISKHGQSPRPHASKGVVPRESGLLTPGFPRERSNG